MNTETHLIRFRKLTDIRQLMAIQWEAIIENLIEDYAYVPEHVAYILESQFSNWEDINFEIPLSVAQFVKDHPYLQVAYEQIEQIPKEIMKSQLNFCMGNEIQLELIEYFDAHPEIHEDLLYDLIKCDIDKYIDEYLKKYMECPFCGESVANFDIHIC